MKIWDNKQNNIMTSRKRNKGKERKAKKAEQEAEKAKLEAELEERERGIVRNNWKSWSRGDINGQIVQCNHGVDLMLLDDKNHPVINFIDAFFMHANNDEMNVGFYFRDTFTRLQEVWDNESYRKMAMNIFISIGTNLLFDEVMKTSNGPYVLSHAIVFLENYDGMGIISTLNSRVVATKMRDLLGSISLRDVLKFYRKRISCSCLKRMHLEARKTLPKTGICTHCHEEKERSLLMVCNRCRILQYCSRECQIASWASRHKRECDMFCSYATTDKNAETEL